MTTVAITGGTGFIGRHVIALAPTRVQSLRLLVRNPPQVGAGATAEIVIGALWPIEAALARLVSGADAVIHCAGAIAPPTARPSSPPTSTAPATLAGRGRRGRRPPLRPSLVASRRASPTSPTMAQASAPARRRWPPSCQASCLLIVRPPGVYGPGDRATLPLHRASYAPHRLHSRPGADRGSR